MLREFETYFLNIITGKQRGVSAFFLRGVLRLLSWPFGMAVACRNWAYDRGWMRRYFPPIPVVISIGNIVVGGTGKTPVTLLIAQEFYQEFSIAVLSRGYRSQAEKLPIPIVLCKGEGPLQSASFCGDEPYLIAQTFPKAHVIVGKNRHKASDIAARAGVQVLLLDDGMQHRKLARDYEVVVLDATDMFGQGYFLPRGFLRDDVRSLSRAHLIILNHVFDSQVFAQLKQEVARYSQAPVVGAHMEVVAIEQLDGRPVDNLKGMKVGIFCGIAHPEYFCQTVMQEGGDIVDCAFVADHLSFDAKTLSDFAVQCKEKGAEMLLCTEKDRVKILDVKGLVLPVASVKTRLKLIEGESYWTAFMDKIKADLRNRL